MSSETHPSPPEPTNLVLTDDGETGEIRSLTFKNRKLHRLLATETPTEQVRLVGDALDLGTEMLDRLSHQGDLDQLAQAVTRLEDEASRIVKNTVGEAERASQGIVRQLTESLSDDEGPFAEILGRFDPATEGNVIDMFRDLVSATIAKATRAAVAEMTDATKEHVESLAKNVAIIDKVAAAEEARLKEAARGTAKGIEHEIDVETLLGELVGASGDGLDDVSTVAGLGGSKKGDKVIRPRGGVAIVTEEKCTTAISENKARELLDASMRNRGADLAMLIVDHESKVPGNQPYHLIDEDKVVVAADPITLRLVYCFMRGKAIELAQRRRGVDDSAIIETLDAISADVAEMARSLEKFKLLRGEHTKATKAIGQAAGYVDEIAETLATGVAAISAQIDRVVDGEEGLAAA
ncbi:MAG: hypothetical protein R8F63_00675 [Acidimicrobiales bacterium]|nr:hypothetical protein [Acidimicrobiales bacterium]